MSGYRSLLGHGSETPLRPLQPGEHDGSQPLPEQTPGIPKMSHAGLGPQVDHEDSPWSWLSSTRAALSCVHSPLQNTSNYHNSSGRTHEQQNLTGFSRGKTGHLWVPHRSPTLGNTLKWNEALLHGRFLPLPSDKGHTKRSHATGTARKVPGAIESLSSKQARWSRSAVGDQGRGDLQPTSYSGWWPSNFQVMAASDRF